MEKDKIQSQMHGIYADIMDGYNPDYKIEIDVDEEMALLLKEIEECDTKFDNNKMDDLIVNCKNVVIDSIIGPFGLTRSMLQDKDGGNVTTVHNFLNDVTASEEDGKKAEAFLSKYGEEPTDKFDRKVYEGKEFKAKRKEIFKNNDAIIDEYTGREIPKDGRSHLDHVVSAHEIDQDPRANLFMSEEERVKMALSDSNLKMTKGSLNQSKSDDKMSDFLKKEDSQYGTKAEKYGVDTKKAMEIDHQARMEMEKKKLVAQVKKQGSELANSGLKEGAAIGFRQALGLVIKEFTEAVFFEIRDMIRAVKGKVDTGRGFFEDLGFRLKRIAEGVLSKWKDVVTAFKDGAVSGFFSNLITFLINNFITTAKRFVRIIREGFNSLVRAIKIMVNPPQGLTKGEAAAEGIKILLAGVGTCIGLLCEQGIHGFIEKLGGPLAPFAGVLSPVITGIITGIGTILIIYAFDQIKDKIELNHKSIVNVNSKILANKYKTLQTLIALDKCVYFTKEVDNYILQQREEFYIILNDSREKTKKGFDDIKNMLSAFDDLI